MERLEEVKIYIENNKKKIIIIMSLLIIMFASSIGIYYYFDFKEETIKVNDEILSDANIINKEIEKETQKEERQTDINNKIKVDIKGEVQNPGVYELDLESRVIDVINLAGGLTKNADTSVNNLSKKIFDEAVIIIYSKDQVSNFIKIKQEEQEKIEESKTQNNIITNDSALDNNDIVINNQQEIDKDTEANENKKISLNNATLEELMTLPSIGESKAKNIIEYREKNGKFETIEDILNVSGIGESVFNKIKEHIQV